MGTTTSTSVTTPQPVDAASSSDRQLQAKTPFAPVIPADASSLYKNFPKRNIPEDFKPTAAVVGAGLAGIHCAWELSRLGFKVTVYDQFRQAGEGATKFDSGLVVNPKKVMHPEMAARIFGAVSESEESIAASSSALAAAVPASDPQYYSSSRYFTYQPLMWRFNATRAYLKSLVPLVFSGTTPVVSGETPFGGIFRESWRTWSQARSKIKPNEKTLITHATSLQQSTADLVDEMVTAAPEKFGHLVIASSGEGKNEKNGWRVIDTSKWCKTLAGILETEYGVQFKYSNMVTRLQWRVDDQTEYVSSVVNTDMTSKKVFASAADLVVIAAGSMSILQRDNKASEGYKLPLLSVAGFGLDIPLSMLGEGAKSILTRSNSSISSSSSSSLSLSSSLDSLMPYQLSDSQFLKVMQTPPSAPVPLRKAGQVAKEDGTSATVWERVEPREPRLRIAGLFSLLGDDIKRNVQPPPSTCIDALAPRVNKSNQNAANQEQAALLRAASEALQRISGEFAVDDPQSGVSGFRFCRGFTSDGLPLISKLGNAKNAFVVCGFGDDASLLAPGAARYLADMIMKKEPVTAEAGNPFSLDRFYKYDYLMKYDDNFDTFQEKWYKGEHWMESFGQPIIDMMWNDFWTKGPGYWLMRGETRDADLGASKYE